MKNSTIRVIIFNAILLAIAFHLVGCGGLVGSIQNNAVSSRPTFQETESSWPILSTNFGRVILYSPYLENQGFMRELGNILFTIDNDKSKVSSVTTGTFVFVDLKPGSHLFGPSPRAWLSILKTTTVTVHGGEFIYLEWPPQSDHSCSFNIVPAVVARESLKSLHHKYEKPLPFLEQKRRLRNVSPGG